MRRVRNSCRSNSVKVSSGTSHLEYALPTLRVVMRENNNVDRVQNSKPTREMRGWTLAENPTKIDDPVGNLA